MLTRAIRFFSSCTKHVQRCDLQKCGRAFVKLAAFLRPVPGFLMMPLRQWTRWCPCRPCQLQPQWKEAGTLWGHWPLFLHQMDQTITISFDPEEERISFVLMFSHMYGYTQAFLTYTITKYIVYYIHIYVCRFGVGLSYLQSQKKPMVWRRQLWSKYIQWKKSHLSLDFWLLVSDSFPTKHVGEID